VIVLYLFDVNCHVCYASCKSSYASLCAQQGLLSQVVCNYEVFLRATEGPAGTAAERVLAMAILSVCLSVWSDTTRYRINLRSDRDSGFSPYDSLESLVSNEVIWCPWVRRFHSNKGIKEGYPLRNRNFATIGSSGVKTVADRHRLVAYYNKHYWRSFRWYQHRWPWTTL